MGKIYGQLQDRAREKLIPFDVMYEVTYGCNLKCLHCYNVPDPTRKEMSAEEAVEVLGQLAEAGAFMLTFTGGEALSRPDFFDIAAAAKKLGFAMCLISNGSLITEEAADRLAELKFTDVSVTMYSRNPEKHDAVTRRPGSCENSMEGMKRLIKRGVKTTLRSVIMKPNREEYMELIKFAEENGVRYLVDPHLSPRQDGSADNQAAQVAEPDMEKVYSEEKMNFSLDSFPRDGFPNPDCDAGRSVCAIDPYGNLLPCIQLPMVLGNLMEKPFKEIWHDSEKVKELRNVSRAIMEDECLSCGYGNYCLRCTGLAYLEGHGLLGKSDSACASARIIKKITTAGKSGAKL